MTCKCLRCGHKWIPRTDNPGRCPRCKSARWNSPDTVDRCLRCGAEWVQRGEVPPKCCPKCHSSIWNVEKATFTCPKCGRTRVLRANSRVGLCPVCDRHADPRPRLLPFDRPSRPVRFGIGRIIKLWSSGDGIVLLSVEGGTRAYAYLDGSLRGTVNLESWCRSNRLDYERLLRNPESNDFEPYLARLAHSMMDDGADPGRVDAVSQLLGIGRQRAEILVLREGGMDPLPIALRLHLTFSEVMDALSDVPPAGAGNLRPGGGDGGRERWESGAIRYGTGTTGA